ncbi:hypothetical protein D3C72_1392300 [compost metagenome]
MQLQPAGAGAAPVLVQQPDGRLPQVRRPGGDHLFRPDTGGGASGADPGRRRDQGLGQAQPVLLPDAAGAGRALRLLAGDRIRGSAGRGAEGGAARLRTRGNRVHLRLRARYQIPARPRLRGHHPQPGTPLSRDRFQHRARGTGQVPEQPVLPELRRFAPAAGGAPYLHRPQDAAPDQPDGVEGCLGLLQRAAVLRPEAGGGGENRQGNQRPRVLPQ